MILLFPCADEETEAQGGDTRMFVAGVGQGLHLRLWVEPRPLAALVPSCSTRTEMAVGGSGEDRGWG